MLRIEDFRFGFRIVLVVVGVVLVVLLNCRNTVVNTVGCRDLAVYLNHIFKCKYWMIVTVLH